MRSSPTLRGQPCHRQRMTAASTHAIATYMSDDSTARITIAVVTTFIAKIWLPYGMIPPSL
jgi:hypothetical protein